MNHNPVLLAPKRMPQIWLCERCRENQVEHTCPWCSMKLCEKCMWAHERECEDER